MRTGWGMNPASWWGCRPAGTPPHLALCCWCALLHQSPRRKACVGLLGFGTHLTWTAPALPAENGYPQRWGPVAARDAVGENKCHGDPLLATPVRSSHFPPERVLLVVVRGRFRYHPGTNPTGLSPAAPRVVCSMGRTPVDQDNGDQQRLGHLLEHLVGCFRA